MVLSEWIAFYDYWFPRNGVINFKHNCNIPPDNRIFSKNIFTKHKFDDNLKNFETELKNWTKMILFSLRKKGSINFLSHIKYKGNDLIMNPLAYKFIRGVNGLIDQNNNFNGLL